jgi:hypothetical protein
MDEAQVFQAALDRLVERGILERDADGCYPLSPLWYALRATVFADDVGQLSDTERLARYQAVLDATESN